VIFDRNEVLKKTTQVFKNTLQDIPQTQFGKWSR